MKPRMVILNIDTICNLFHDYVGQVGFPDDAISVKFMFNQQERKVAVIVESESFTGPQAPEEVRFGIKRVYAVN